MKIGLVFSGGGGKGAYEIGVWKALRELDLEQHVAVVSGTSVGALNAGMFSQGRYDEAEEFWLNISSEMVLGIKKEDIEKIKFFFLKNYRYVLPATILAWLANFKLFGVLRREPLERIIRQFIDEDRLRNSPISCYATASELPLLKRTHFKVNDYKKEMMVQILLASAAIPVLWKSVSINGHDFADGGFSREMLTPGEITDQSNVPLAPASLEGCSPIFVVYLDRSNKIPDRMYPHSTLIDIVPSRSLGGLINGTLQFDKETARNHLDLGYGDTILLFREAMKAEKTLLQMRGSLKDIIGKKQEFQKLIQVIKSNQEINSHLLGNK